MSPLDGSSRLRAALAAALVAAPWLAATAAAQTCTYVAEAATWLYHAAPPPADWTLPGALDDPEESGWRLGCAPFSSNGCGFAPGTDWPISATLHLRQHVWLAGGETGLSAYVAIDNDFEMFVNGTRVGSLVHEGCATRWDAVVPIPDAVLVSGDNVLAVRITDRGGISNFEMTLSGTSPAGCPPGCALLPCGTPGPEVRLADVFDCPGRLAPVLADARWDQQCPSELSYRFRGSDGRVTRRWDADPTLVVRVGDDDMVGVDVRCGYSPTCPMGSGWCVVSAPAPPLDPGPVVRVRKPAGLAVVSWDAAPPLLPTEHFHARQGAQPDGAFTLVGGEALTARAWTDPEPFGRAFYLVRVADTCETESVDER
jgi:hypothetical protein